MEKRKRMSASLQRDSAEPAVKKEKGSPTKKALEEVVEPKQTFGTCDTELFRSGAHADVRIRAGSRDFRAHRAILAGRSTYFRDKLEELEKIKVQEGTFALPVINVTSHSPHDVEMVLVYIYQGEVDPKADIDPSFAVACIRLYNLGQDFGVASLPDFATNELGNYLSNVLKMICDKRLSHPSASHPGRTEIQDRLRANNFLPHYLAAVELADKVARARPDLVRPFQMLIDFFVAGKEVLLAEPDMELFLDADLVPAFARCVLLTERKGCGGRSRWFRGMVERPPRYQGGKRGLCWECGGGLRNMKETGGVGFVNPKSFELNWTQALCVHCCDRERNLDEQGLVKWEVFDPQKD